MKQPNDIGLARALLQLTIYLESCRAPLSLAELYHIAYGDLWQEMPGGTWLEGLEEDTAIRAARDEPYTLKTVFDTLSEHQLGLLIEVVEEETAKLGIGMGLIQPGRYLPRKPREDNE